MGPYLAVPGLSLGLKKPKASLKPHAPKRKSGFLHLDKDSLRCARHTLSRINMKTKGESYTDHGGSMFDLGEDGTIRTLDEVHKELMVAASRPLNRSEASV